MKPPRKTLYILTFTLILTLASVLTCAYAEEAAEEQALLGYQIGPENVLLIDVYYGRDENLSRKVRVSAKGFMTFPLLGEVEAGGLTIAELEKKLTELLEKDYLVNPQVSVFIEEYSTVSILGQVKEPGTYPIKGRLTVVEVISTAGGFTKIAATNNVRIMRTDPDGDRKTMVVKVNDIINKGKEEDDVRLKPGDIVTVPESFF
ncbi:MAG: polysaccharide biosynthesis/export family protein [Candidatus Omnitrophota bacterium]